jgi:hypothetical protein
MYQLKKTKLAAVCQKKIIACRAVVFLKRFYLTYQQVIAPKIFHNTPGTYVVPVANYDRECIQKLL